MTVLRIFPLFSAIVVAGLGIAADQPKAAAVSTIDIAQLDGFERYSPELQALVSKALDLTRRNLTYTFASADPARGGMDCSGTIYFTLRAAGITDVPRQSDDICLWVKDRTQLHRTENISTLSNDAFNALKPGDLLFWTGTYAASERKLPISHVMLYLGRRKADGKPVIFGASDGRSYEGQRRCGVSVFDFKLPKPGDKASFYGYGPIPGLTTVAAAKPASD